MWTWSLQQFSNLTLPGVTSGSGWQNSPRGAAHTSETADISRPLMNKSLSHTRLVWNGHWGTCSGWVLTVGLAAVTAEQHESSWLHFKFKFFRLLDSIFCKMFPYLLYIPKSMSPAHAFVEPFHQPCTLPSLSRTLARFEQLYFCCCLNQVITWAWRAAWVISEIPEPAMCDAGHRLKGVKILLHAQPSLCPQTLWFCAASSSSHLLK